MAVSMFVRMVAACSGAVASLLVGAAKARRRRTRFASTVLVALLGNDESYGVLKLTLSPKSYGWRFIPVEGEIFGDSGSAPCH
jgi:hypothetical protein